MQQKCENVYHYAADDDGRRGIWKESHDIELKIWVYEKILRVADWRKHAAHVRRDGLPCDHGDKKAGASRLGQYGHGERDENYEGHVVRYYHGAEKAAEYEKSSEASAAYLAMKDMAIDESEEAALSQARDNGHEAEQKKQKREIDAAQHQQRLKWHGETRKKCENPGDRQIGIASKIRDDFKNFLYTALC